MTQATTRAAQLVASVLAPRGGASHPQIPVVDEPTPAVEEVGRRQPETGRRVAVPAGSVAGGFASVYVGRYAPLRCMPLACPDALAQSAERFTRNE